MNDTPKNRNSQLVFALVAVALGAGAIAYWGPPTKTHLTPKELNNEDGLDSGAPKSVALVSALNEDLVRRYVTAYQNSDCAEVARMTLWVHDRLEAIDPDLSEAAVDTEYQSLCNGLFSRSIGENRISILGIDEQYLIPRTVTFTIEGADAGREDLAAAVLERVWVSFMYDDPSMAPRDEEGKAIRSIRAGLNISINQLILKGSVRGNWEIDFDSISLQW